MACPIAAGAAALLMQSNSSLKGNPESVRNALFQTASNNGEQNNTDGYGHLNVRNALNYIAGTTPSPTPTATLTPLPTPGGNGFLYGTVYDQDNFPLEGVTVTIIGNDFSDSIDTNEDGYFEFADLDADTYVIIAKKKGFKRDSKTVILEDGKEKELQIKMKKAKKIYFKPGIIVNNK